MARNWYYAKVMDSNDPLNLGRVRADILTDDKSAIQKSDTFDPVKDTWTENDPFTFNSLLPIYLFTVPLKDELIQIYYHDNETAQFLNAYYIQGPINRIQNIGFENFNQSGKYTDIKGIQVLGAKDLRNTDGTYKDIDPDGVFPNPGDVAQLGRGSTDVIHTNDTVLMRAGKYKGKLTGNANPVGNPNRAFLQLSKFGIKTTIGKPQVFVDTKVKNLQIKYLVEWDITNPENQLTTSPVFSGAIRLYRLRPDENTQSKNVKVSSNLEQYKFIINQQDFNNVTLNDVTKLINNYIKVCNSKTKLPSGEVLFSVIEDRYPIYFRPTNRIYDYMLNSVDVKTKENLNTVFKDVKLNPNDKQGGYGLIYALDKTGEPINVSLKGITPTDNIELPETHSALGGQYVYLLSQYAQIPGKNKINFLNNLYGITESQFNTQIQPNTSSMVRGEELLELLNVIVRFLITHEHGYPGEPPISITQDGSSVSNVLKELNDAYENVLNQYIRLN